MRILVVDNYDSFVFNLVQYLGQLGGDALEVEVLRNDDPRLGPDQVAAGGYGGVLVSPGPGTPERAGRSMAVIEECAEAGTPVLGVSLGHQAIGAVWGATVVRAPELVHGKTSLVHHHGDGVLAGLPEPFTATRYHSLTIAPETLPDVLVPTAHTETGIVMAVRHRDLLVDGVQFHPESVLTEGGHRMLATWLGRCGFDVTEARVAELEQEMAEGLAPALSP